MPDGRGVSDSTNAPGIEKGRSPDKDPGPLLPYKMKRGWVRPRAEEVEEGPFGVHYPAPVKYLAPL